ncbi:MAG: DnaB-like helicase C-terminal domain-containing protein [Cyanobacteriota bacterium]|nr:DnaB-like helicase C-terminal domain-containing protein [Cyanobacteriota bacterium]
MTPTPGPSAPEASGSEAFATERLDALITAGEWLATAHGPLPVPSSTPEPEPPAALVEHERALLAAVLQGNEDHSPRWGLFRRRIGLRFCEPVPEAFWSQAELRLVAAEIDAVFRGQRDIRTINAEAIRQGARERAITGRFGGSLQQLEAAIGQLLAWGEGASPLDFPLACDLLQSAKARQVFYPALRRLLEREQRDSPIDGELEQCRRTLNEALAITAGRFRTPEPLATATDAARGALALATLPAEQRPVPISTGIPSFDLDIRGGVIAGAGENTFVLAARSGIGKTTLAIAAAMGLAHHGAGVLVVSCELSERAIAARLMAHYCRRAHGLYTPWYSSNDLEGRGRVISGKEQEQLQQWAELFAQGLRPDGQPMGPVLYQSRFGATVEAFCALVEDAKAANPQLSVVVLDHFHAMGASPGYGPNTTAELAARAMAIKALAGRCSVDVLVVAQLNRGAYNGAPDVSHLAGTSELERYASAVWLIDRPRPADGPPPPAGLLEVHHGKFRHGQMASDDLSRTTIRLDRSHCFLEADEARLAFCGDNLYPGVAVR